ncbi:MAG: MopE-related protein, partial [Myxococcales bacterium]
MREVTTGRVRRQAPLFAALVLSLLSIPLLAPTCSQSSAGLRTFSKKSIIIPMDACYQGDGTTTPVACPGSADNGRLLYGYGLVYRLLQEGVTVYWVIAPNKTSLTDVDLTVQFNAGAPVGKYNWTNGTFASRPPNNSTAIANYRGGPFVIDGAEFDKANALLQGALKSTFSQVNLHVTNVAFSGYVARAMNGGWTAGGTQPPPIALLNITGGDCKNSLSTVTQYLKDAGLGNVPNAAGTAAGPHGAIYDVLDYADFLPNLSGSRLGQNGYRVLWAPHWVGRNSCTRTCVQGSSGPVCNSLIPATSVDNIRTTIRQFVAAGGDLFSECSSIGAVEGDANHCDTASIVQNSAAGRIATTGGLSINQYGWDFQCPGSKGARFYYPQFAPLQFTQYSSPLLQIAEFPFSANSGAIGNYQPMAGSAWTSNVQHLITDTTGAWDVFTVKPTVNGSGTTVYLAGHDYSTIGNPYQLSGSRMVLNTLFNLGAGCVTTNADCQTGKLGECGKGKMQCVNGAPTCVQVNQPAAETCDNKDNDCNGLVDDGLAQACYTGPSATRNVGACRAGTSTCTAGVWSSCQGQVLPTAELCNGIDDDCEGRIDNGVAPRACYGGPVGTSGLGECKSGTQACQSGTWGTCSGEVRPVAEVCSDGKDNNCDGAVDEGCGCLTGQVQPCYAGPNGTVGVGICKRGTQTCTAGAWGRCTGEQLPQTEVCNGLDDDCDGQTDEDGVCDECSHGQTRSCYTGPPGTQNVGACRAGAQECVNGKWGGCNGQVLPGPELCDGKDNDCDGELDDQAPCPDKLACINGVCVPPKCTGELARCPEGYACRTGGCAPVVCGTAVCPAGTRCLNGVCSDPCDGVRCGQGAICAGGVCSGGGCYATGCPQGQLCRDGSCAPDSCSGQTCPAGAFCRDGYCVQSCAFVSCPTGQRCGPDGLCI